MAYTGSRKDLNGRDVGVLNLRGPVPGAIPSLYTDRRTNGNYRFSGVDGCTLALFNSINTLVKLGDINPAITSSDNVDQPFAIYGDVTLPLLPGTKEILTTRGVEAGPGSLPTLGSTERNNPQSYFRFNLSGSDLLEYRVMIPLL